MPCFYPIPAFRSDRCLDARSGKPKIFFKEEFVKPWPGYESFKVPCGQCIGCRLERSKQWAIRCVHEASLHDDNCFITLTYDDKHLPFNGALQLVDFQNFMKRFRKAISPKRVRFFHCGEYGDQFGRPHYHACIFGYRFSDLEPISNSNSRIFYSPFLAQLWPYGFSSVGEVTYESAAYVARYITKKINGDEAEEHYSRVDEQGNVVRLPAEYITMSRRPGIGRDWFEKYEGDVFPCDEVVMNGKKLTVPRFYGNLFEVKDPSGFADIKRRRKSRMEALAADNTPERLKTKEIVTKARFSQLKRGFENG